ncbi:hypothetical protein GCM10007989_29600 [Devosia pacifica]|uniref:Uncharacterized protein n=1 Tax=Devosia pacifica TaxID=1335967 RepID=A0A918SC40_9HYPH|nr:hypothetical protein [Devosia pacifica]GHA31615.1 hypothetical protein GCM10007989_29600 [Devosia pacifica]
MEFLGPYGWLIATLGGAIILGLAIAWGMRRSSQRTPQEKARTEAGVHEEYRKEDQER